MKVKALTRASSDYVGRSGDVYRLPRNASPAVHPFHREREYTRALQATKLDKIMAKPFLCAFDQHSDAVQCLATHPRRLRSLYSASADGELKSWDLSNRELLWSVGAHDGFVRGLACTSTSNCLVTCGTDRTVKVWDLDQCDARPNAITPVKTLLGSMPFTGVDTHWRDDSAVVTCGSQVDVWSLDRSDPVHSFKWGADTITTVKFNKVEVDILASCASDRSVTLYDTRLKSPIRKLILTMCSNALAWNPMEPFNFTVANEDTNLYTFDMRKMDIARNVHSDHVAAVMAVDYAPTGREIVSGGYDRAVRIWADGEGRSREVYVARRMQRILSVKFSADNRFVLSGSDDTNIRLWKAQASKSLQAMLPREKRHLQYQDRLKARFAHVKDVQRIARHRHLPSAIFKEQKKIRVVEASQKRKESNRRSHSKPGAVPFVPRRVKNIVKVEE
ncbi:hypothetical protein PBRA_001089 [Plasmodiophora brassicae]|uniref:DDB1- and CUL4-associated factor 13 n=1 Tax=Plasmodiophora brassicae TaxID=37360 RepID=A0A0G4IV41_PLABS|nr:hypothetical protein PBRA_001089 [Plasmodiophora brassicae]